MANSDAGLTLRSMKILRSGAGHPRPRAREPPLTGQPFPWGTFASAGTLAIISRLVSLLSVWANDLNVNDQ